MNRSKTGFTYIETAIALTLFAMMVAPFCMMHLASVKTRVVADRIEEVTQKLENLTSELKRKIVCLEDIDAYQIDETYYKTNQYDYEINSYDIETLSEDIDISHELRELLKENSQESPNRITIDATGSVDCQYSSELYIGERAKIKVGEEIIGTSIDIAKGNNFFQNKSPLTVTLDITLLEMPFTIKLSNAIDGPLIIQLKGEPTFIHFIIEDPNGQTILIEDNRQKMKIHYKIVTIQVSDATSQRKVLAKTLFFQRYQPRKEDKNER